jgi:hypothetical protein
MGSVRRVVVATVLVLLVAAQSSAAQRSAVPAFTQIPIDLSAPVIETVLPFDVPFLFTGATPSGAIELTVTWVDITARARAAHRRRASNGMAQPEFACPAINEGGWRPLRTMLGLNGTFAIQVPRLDANHYYCFNFNTKKSLDAATLQAFRARAALMFDDRLRAVGDEFQSTDALRQLRADLIAAVSPPEVDIRLEVKHNSIFETVNLTRNPERAADLQAIETKFRETVRPLRELRAQRNRAIATFRNFAQPTVDQFLKAVKEMPAFHQLTTQLAALPATSPIPALVTDGFPVFQRFDALSPAELVDAVWGGSRTSEAEITAWSSSEVDARLNRLTTLMRDLNTMKSTLQTINTPARVTAIGGGLTEAQLTALSTQIDTVIGTLTTQIETLVDLKTILDRRQTEIATVVRELSAVAVQDVLLLATSVGDFSTRHSWYLSADLGFLWAWDLDEMVPYAGMNIYFRPVNKDAPLQEFGSFAASFTRRFSAMVGVTVAGDLTKIGEREALFSDRMIVLGAGVRLTDSIRFAGGAVLLRALDPNPVIDHKVIRASPFISFSVDWNVRDTFAGLGSNAPPPPPLPAPPPATPPQ